jgi:hypothetical protein
LNEESNGVYFTLEDDKTIKQLQGASVRRDNIRPNANLKESIADKKVSSRHMYM